MVFLITGACGGLGKAFSATCAQKGCALILTDLDADKLERLKEGITKMYGVDVITIPCDLTDEAERDRFYLQIDQYKEWLNGLINIAGGDPEGSFAERDLRSIRESIDLNVLSVTELVNVVVRMRSDNTKPFTIINVSSLAAFQPMPYKALYSASKRYILQLTLALRKELKPHNISLTTLCPAGMPTTADCIEAIRVQGLLGRITTKNVGEVADQCFNQAIRRKKAILIPGTINRMVGTLSNLIPDTLKAGFVEKRWAKAISKRDFIGGGVQ